MPEEQITLKFIPTRLDNAFFNFLLVCAYLYFKYGAIGGRIATKPGKHAPTPKSPDHHLDFGNVKIIRCPDSIDGSFFSHLHTDLENYSKKLNKEQVDKIKQSHDSLPNFNYFFFYTFSNNFSQTIHVLNYRILNQHFFGLKEMYFKDKKYWGWDPDEKREWVHYLRGNNFRYPFNKPTRGKRLFVYKDRLWGWQKNDRFLDETEAALSRVLDSKFVPERFIRGKQLLNERKLDNA
jgi:hypothetical protein